MVHDARKTAGGGFFVSVWGGWAIVAEQEYRPNKVKSKSRCLLFVRLFSWVSKRSNEEGFY